MLKTHPYKSIIYWLLTGFFLIALMVVVGGITRLTDSGLSMTDWKLISGVVPPLNEAEWQEAFKKYQDFPEYQKINKGMSVNEFKTIFFWEYIHRVLGRFIGIVFIIPFLFFWIRKRFPKRFLPKMIFIFMLGAFQGFLGWWMVKSGLVDRPEVSHFRLAAHLVSAFALIAYTFWVLLELYYQKPFPAHQKLHRSIKWILGLFVLQIIYGAFVAGLKAGLICPTFPRMCSVSNLLAGNWIGDLSAGMPEHLVKLNLQNIHRFLAYIVYGFVTLLYLKSRSWNLTQAANKAVKLLFVLVNAQFVLGVLTILYQVPVFLGVLHQFGALCLLINGVYLLKISK